MHEESVQAAFIILLKALLKQYVRIKVAIAYFRKDLRVTSDRSVRERREDGSGKIIREQQSSTAKGQENHDSNAPFQTWLQKRCCSARDQRVLPGGTRTLFRLRKTITYMLLQKEPLPWYCSRENP